MSDVTITIKRKKRTPSRGTSRRKGMLAKAPGKQDLGRRRVKSDVVIRFWDLGQYANGDPVYPSFVDVSTGSMNDLIDGINAILTAVADPFATFMPLDKASPVATELSIAYGGGAHVGKPADLDAYSGNTLSITASEFETFGFGGLGMFFAIASNVEIPSLNAFHVTNVPDPDAEDVPLPGGSIDIGLAPAAALQLAQVEYDFPLIIERLNRFYAVIQRNVAPILAGPSSVNYDEEYERWRVMRLSPDARADQSTGGPPSPISPSAFAPSGFYPAPPATPTGSFFSTLGLNPAETYSDMLLAIIRKGSQLYYVWRSTE